MWRFVELSRRVDFLLAGLGWCRMPRSLVAPMLANGTLVAFRIEDDSVPGANIVTIYATRMRDRALGRAASWLLEYLQRRFEGIRG